MNILMVYGGKSCEHDISVITACLAKGYFEGKIWGAYFTCDNVCFLVPNDTTPKQHKKCKFRWQIVFLNGRKQIALVRKNRIRKVVNIDVAVNCCHGRCGEDGAVAALCNLCGIPLVGSDIVASAVAMDKFVTKLVLQSLGFPVVEGVLLHSGDDCQAVRDLGFPIIVKPCTLGSSIGISLCRNNAELDAALAVAFTYDNRVLCERALTDFYELNCSAMCTKNGVKTSRVDRPYTSHEILTFQDKYQNGEKSLKKSSDVDAALAEKVKSLTAKIYAQLGLGGVVRVDYLVCNNDLWVNEVNSIPGSLAFGLWEEYSPLQFGKILVEQALQTAQENSELNSRYNSGILDGNFAKK